MWAGWARTGDAMKNRRVGAIGTAMAALTAILLSACGGGDGAEGIQSVDEHKLQGYHVATLALPPAERGTLYDAVLLEVTEPGVHGLAWTLRDGSLPPGMELTEDGWVQGTPGSKGFYAFTVHVTDGLRAGTGRLAVAVDDFGVFVQSGLVTGDAWSGRDIKLRAAGHEGHVSYAVVTNDSGAQLLHADGAAGTVTYRPGWAGGNNAQDVIQAIDLANGRSHILALDVRPDPLANHTAEFGSTDVWYVNMNRKMGAHPYASDMHATLVQVGLRAPESYDMLGNEADRLAALWVRLEALRRLNELYRRNADGTAGPAGLPVSFPFEEPGPGYRKPAPGNWINGASNHYSEMSLLEGRPGGVVGTAFVDDGANTLHENNTTLGPERLGVFLNVLGTYFNAVYSHRALRTDPIDADDVEALRALLDGRPSPGGRYTLIRDAGRDFANALATVVAHEIGHSLGLEHTYGLSSNSIMSASATIGPGADPQFTPDDISRLSSRLPGPGRYGGRRSLHAGGASAAATMPAGGVRVCHGRKCNLVIRIPGDER